MNKTLTTKFIYRYQRIAFVFTEDDKKITIQPRNFKGAFDGDTVKVAVDLKTQTGKVLEIIEKQKEPYYGRVIRVWKNKILVQLNRSDILVRLPKSNDLNVNDLVSVKINNTTIKDYKSICAELVKNYGNINNSENVFNNILDRSNIPTSFSKDIRNEAIKIKRPDIEKELENRIDLRDKHTITIDDITAKDLDDAIYLEKDDNFYTLWVSIADVSHFVKENSLLDKEAFNRGNSVYLVDKVIPMFPKKLSNNLCSLNPNEDKLCFTIKLKYNLKGKLIETDFFKSIINSKERYSYDEVNKIFETKSNKLPMLHDMLELSKMLRSKKNKKGMINFDIPEIKVILDKNNQVSEIKTRSSGLAENLIEDFMIEANKAVAEKLFWQELPAIYRVHETPSYDSLSELNKKLNLLGYNIKNIQDIKPSKMSKVINSSKDDEKSYLIHKLILRSMMKAKYHNKDLGHFGLALDHYLHFTSPIRRYSDLVVHRMLYYSITNYRNLDLNKLDTKFKNIAEHISNTERIAERLERDSINLKLLDYMKSKKGKIMKAMISGIKGSKVFLQLSNNIEVCSYIENSPNYVFNEDSIISTSDNKEYFIGEYVNIRILNLDYERIEITSEVI